MSQAALLAAERSRCATFVARDAQALAATLHEDLVYIHATGVRHDRRGLARPARGALEHLLRRHGVARDQLGPPLRRAASAQRTHVSLFTGSAVT